MFAPGFNLESFSHAAELPRIKEPAVVRSLWVCLPKAMKSRLSDFINAENVFPGWHEMYICLAEKREMAPMFASPPHDPFPELYV